jgi:hypothetical protein
VSPRRREFICSCLSREGAWLRAAQKGRQGLGKQDLHYTPIRATATHRYGYRPDIERSISLASMCRRHSRGRHHLETHTRVFDFHDAWPRRSRGIASRGGPVGSARSVLGPSNRACPLHASALRPSKTLPALQPMPLLRLPEPFDHPDWLFEVKHHGFRALAHIDGAPLRTGVAQKPMTPS